MKICLLGNAPNPFKNKEIQFTEVIILDTIDFNLDGKKITVQNIFKVSPQSTNFKIIDNNCNELWSGTELKKCDYRKCGVSFMRVVGEPYKNGYIELRISKD